MGDPLLKRRRQTVLRNELEAVERVLVESGEMNSALRIRRILDGSEKDFQEFLVSNELWGGAGSIADEAGVSQGRDVRRSIEAALIKLGEQQLYTGTVNARTKMWCDVFSTWQRDGI